MTHTDTGTDIADRRAVEPGHARSLADHGHGWAIMWDDRDDQPVIVRPERGDDGTLLEICTYEEMFTLGGHCATREDARTCEECMPGGRAVFEMIADHMTDILGDYYISRADIAACMPSPSPTPAPSPNTATSAAFRATATTATAPGSMTPSASSTGHLTATSSG